MVAFAGRGGFRRVVAFAGRGGFRRAWWQAAVARKMPYISGQSLVREGVGAGQAAGAAAYRDRYSCHPDRRRTWGENVRTFVQTHRATCAGVRAGVGAGNCAGACAGRARAAGRPNAGPLGIGPLGLANHFSHWPAMARQIRSSTAVGTGRERVAFRSMPALPERLSTASWWRMRSQLAGRVTSTSMSEAVPPFMPLLHAAPAVSAAAS